MLALFNLTFIALFACMNGVVLDDTIKIVPQDHQLEIALNHDQQCFTQGLEFIAHNQILESCGKFHISKLKLTSFPQFETIKEVPLPEAAHFAEGLTVIDNIVFLLTWKNKRILWYSLPDLELLRNDEFQHEGYGAAYNPQNNILYATNSSEYINKFSVSTDDLTITFLESVPVVDAQSKPIEHLNELEWIPCSLTTQGCLLANIWYSPYMLVLNPDNGEVIQSVDFSLLESRHRSQGVLNGIAYYPYESDLFSTGSISEEEEEGGGIERFNLLLTGKEWTKSYLYTLSLNLTIIPTVNIHDNNIVEDDTLVDSDEKDPIMINDEIPASHIGIFYLSARVCGFIYVASWTLAWYPQMFLNYRLKSVAGMSIDMVMYNVVGFALYTFFVISMFVIEAILDAPRVVEGSDVIFSLHSLVANMVYVSQYMRYDRGGQKWSYVSKVICGMLLVGALFLLIQCYTGQLDYHPFADWTADSVIPVEERRVHSWSFLHALGALKASTNLFKYLPQILLNWRRRSTAGMDVSQYALDFSGGLFSFLENLLDALSAQNFDYMRGNIPKLVIASCSMMYDSVIMAQHWCCGYGKNAAEERSLQRNAVGCEIAMTTEDELQDMAEEEGRYRDGKVVIGKERKVRHKGKKGMYNMIEGGGDGDSSGYLSEEGVDDIRGVSTSVELIY